MNTVSHQLSFHFLIPFRILAYNKVSMITFVKKLFLSFLTYGARVLLGTNSLNDLKNHLEGQLSTPILISVRSMLEKLVRNIEFNKIDTDRLKMILWGRVFLFYIS